MYILCFWAGYTHFDFSPILRKIFGVMVTIINLSIYNMIHTFPLEWKISSGLPHVTAILTITFFTENRS